MAPCRACALASSEGASPAPATVADTGCGVRAGSALTPVRGGEVQGGWLVVGAARRRAGAGHWAPAPWCAPGGSTRSGQPFIPRISGVGSVRGSEGGFAAHSRGDGCGMGVVHAWGCRSGVQPSPASAMPLHARAAAWAGWCTARRSVGMMQQSGSRLGDANNRFRGGFCPQRV